MFSQAISFVYFRQPEHELSRNEDSLSESLYHNVFNNTKDGETWAGLVWDTGQKPGRSGLALTD